MQEIGPYLSLEFTHECFTTSELIHGRLGSSRDRRDVNFRLNSLMYSTQCNMLYAGGCLGNRIYVEPLN